MPNEIFDTLQSAISPGTPKEKTETVFDWADRNLFGTLRPQRQPDEPALPKLSPVGGNEIAELLAPLVQPDRLQLQEQYLDRARARVKDRGEGLIPYLSRRIVPFGSSVVGNIEQQAYADALNRFQKGVADEKDIDTIARAERQTEIEHGRNIAETALSTATHLPAVLGEAYVGGSVAGRAGLFGRAAAPEVGSLLTREGLKAAVRQAPRAAAQQTALTPVMPSTWLEESAQNAARKGGNWYDPENVAPALAHGALQNAVLGSVGKFANRAPGGLAGRAGVGAVVMPMESAAADVFASVVDDLVMPDAYKLKTQYGTLGQLARGETNDAMKRLVVEALTGAAFAAFHGKDHTPQLVALKKSLDAIHDADVPPEEAATVMTQVQAAARSATTPEARKAVVEAVPEHFPQEFKDYVQAVVDASAGPPASRARQRGLAPPVMTTGEPLNRQRGRGPAPEPTQIATEGELPPVAPGSTLPRSGPDVAAEPSGTSISRPGASQGQETASEFDVLRDAIFRVPDSKGQNGPQNLSWLRSELLKGAAGKSASRGAEANDPHWQDNQFQIVIDPNHLPPEAIRPGARNDLKVDYPALAENPALLAVRFKGTADHAAFAEAKDLIDGINEVRIKSGLDPVALFSKEGQVPAQPVKMTAVERFFARGRRGNVEEKPRPPVPSQREGSVNDYLDLFHKAVLGEKKGSLGRQAMEVQGEFRGIDRKAKAMAEEMRAGSAGIAPPVKTGPKTPEQVRQEALTRRLDILAGMVKDAARQARKGGEEHVAHLRDTVDRLRKTAEVAGKKADAILKEAVGKEWEAAAKKFKLTEADRQKRIVAAEKAANREAAPKSKLTSLDRAIMGLGQLSQSLGANRAVSTSLGDYADVARKGKAVSTQVKEESLVPRAIFAGKGKGGVDLETMASMLWREGHIESNDPQALWQAIIERKPSLRDFDEGGAVVKRMQTQEEQRQADLAEEAKHAPIPLDAVAREERLIRKYGPDYRDVLKAKKAEREEATSFDVDKIEAEAAAERLLAEQVQKNREPGLPEAMGAASFGFKPQNKPMREQLVEHLKDSAKRWVQGVQDFVGKLGGQIAPTISRASEEAGNMVARLGAVGHYARLWPTVMLDRIMPDGSGQADRLRLGATMVEWVLRDIRSAHLREGDKASQAGVQAHARAQAAATRARTALTPTARRDARSEAAQAAKERAAAFKLANEHRQKAADVISVVGGSFKDPSMAYPLPDEAAYQAALADPAIQRMIAKHKSEAAPDLIRFFEQATGKKHDEFDSLRNFDAMPISLVVPHESEPSSTTFIPGTSRGKLGNQRLRRVSASYEATGASSKGYELDFGKILERMAADRFPTGTKAEAFRVWEKEGIGRWGKPGDALGVNGEMWKRMPDVTPPKGTQANESGETAFFVDPKYYDEIHQVLGLNKPPGQVPFSSVLSTLTLASTVEAAYHTRNLLTMLTRPGMNPLDVIRHARKLVLGDADTMKAVLHLAELGAMKEHGFEAQTLGGKYNPLTYFNKATSAMLSVVDRSVRLAASDAFDRVTKIEGVENTERARRDFINQVGNYSKLTQSRIVAWLRDTGLGPFATAGSTFYMAGLKGLVGGHGLRTTSYKADVRLRAEMLLRMATLPAIAAALNYALWGRVDGDDQTPVFGLKLGTGKNGRTSYLDLGGLTGITRGMRETGLLSLAEASRPAAKARGSTTGDVIDRGVKDAARSALHPAIGPVVAFADTLLTGKNSLGGNIAPRADLKKGESQTELNLWAALWHSNLILESLEHPARGLVGIEDRRREKPTWEVLSKFLGPFGPKTSGNVPGEPHRSREMPVPASPIQGRELQAKKGLAPPRR